MIRNSIFLTGLLCLTILVFGCRFTINGSYRFDYRGAKSERNEIGDLDASVRKIVVDNRFGDVVIVRLADKPGWEWTGACWATASEDADEFLNELGLTVKQSGETQSWSVELPESHRLLRGVRSDLTIRVPASVEVSVRNRHGNTQIEKTTGDVEIYSQHGDVKLSELIGKVKVRNQHGKVFAHGLASDGDFDIQHGESTFTDTHGKLEIRSQHGDVKLSNVGGDISAKLQHGDLIARQMASSIKFTTQHGTVDLEMVGDQFDSIRGSANHSNIKIALPEECLPKVDVDLNHGRLRSEVGTDSGSKVLIKIKANHTNVSLKKSEE